MKKLVLVFFALLMVITPLSVIEAHAASHDAYVEYTYDESGKMTAICYEYNFRTRSYEEYNKFTSRNGNVWRSTGLRIVSDAKCQVKEYMGFVTPDKIRVITRTAILEYEDGELTTVRELDIDDMTIRFTYDDNGFISGTTRSQRGLSPSGEYLYKDKESKLTLNYNRYFKSVDDDCVDTYVSANANGNLWRQTGLRIETDLNGLTSRDLAFYKSGILFFITDDGKLKYYTYATGVVTVLESGARYLNVDEDNLAISVRTNRGTIDLEDFL